jgi:hypothetical protein
MLAFWATAEGQTSNSHQASRAPDLAIITPLFARIALENPCLPFPQAPTVHAHKPTYTGLGPPLSKGVRDQLVKPRTAPVASHQEPRQRLLNGTRRSSWC